MKLNRAFDLTEGQGTRIVLDLDGDRSIHRTGSNRYMMTPVVGVVSVE
ncbi:MAG: DUF4382 domain-containing protein [Acidimicrobiia bacterium]|nr:DUF4382 domain-containing protein [Acidimicrobiia bacterium]